jgi:AcrR family transcriptional regulator
MEARRALLDAVKSLVAERGARAVSVSAIAQRAGVAKGLLFYYFDAKDDLVRAALEELDAAYAAHVSSLPAAGGCMERLRALIRHHFDFLERDPDGAQFLYQTAAAGAPALGFYRHLHGAILALLTQGAAVGEFKTEDPEELAYMLLGSLHGIGRLKLFDFKRDYDAARHLISFYEKVLLGGGAPSARIG